MNALSLTVILIGVCVSAIILLVMAKPLKILLGILLNGVLGVAGLFAANMILAPLGFTLGINALTIGFTALLGLPGFCALILIAALM